jgi:hypothetical protein
VSSKLQRDYIAANLAAIEGLLGTVEPDDFIVRSNLESRRDELREELEASEAAEHPLASVSLLFGGEPVVGNRAIDARFCSDAVGKYQDLVSKWDTERRGHLKQRGPVPGQAKSNLHIAGIERGSFGFQLIEIEDNLPLSDSSLKDTVEDVAQLLASFDPDESVLPQELVGTMNNRVLESVREFFEILHNRKATMRLISQTVDKQFNRDTLDRVVQRVRATTMDERDESFDGQLVGLMTQRHTFEFCVPGQPILYGKLDASLTEQEAREMAGSMFRDVAARIRVKRVIQGPATEQIGYVLMGIAER